MAKKVTKTNSKKKKGLGLDRLKMIARKFPNDAELGHHIRNNIIPSYDI